eukprot:symbB.v1.2.030690.t1/scaffold3488.1/size55655/4
MMLEKTGLWIDLGPMLDEGHNYAAILPTGETGRLMQSARLCSTDGRNVLTQVSSESTRKMMISIWLIGWLFSWFALLAAWLKLGEERAALDWSSHPRQVAGLGELPSQEAMQRTRPFTQQRIYGMGFIVIVLMIIFGIHSAFVFIVWGPKLWVRQVTQAVVILR